LQTTGEGGWRCLSVLTLLSILAFQLFIGLGLVSISVALIHRIVHIRAISFGTLWRAALVTTRAISILGAAIAATSRTWTKVAISVVRRTASAAIASAWTHVATARTIVATTTMATSTVTTTAIVTIHIERAVLLHFLVLVLPHLHIILGLIDLTLILTEHVVDSKYKES